ncbi:MAG: beta-glucosidase [Cytophagales bacterium]|nr:beta-glucosidase [Cytophagales bacterium]
MRILIYIFLIVTFTECTTGNSKVTSQKVRSSVQISDDSVLNLVQYQTFRYFWDGAEPTSGMARERLHMDDIYPHHPPKIITSGGSGFGLMAILVGIERGFISRREGFERFLKIVGFLERADSFHGVWPHWWDGETGRVAPFSKKDDGGDLVETSFLVQGLLCVRQYFKDGTEEEQELAGRIDALWKNVEWDWHTRGGENVLYWHWSPNYGWDMNFDVRGYNECLIMYVLAASSPTHPIDPAVYHEGWAMNGDIKTDREFLGYRTVLNHYETNNSPVGPLFWAHYSYLGLDPRHLSDRYADYWTLNRNHALIHYKHCVENPNQFKGYGTDCWGLTSSYSIKGYAGHRPDKDLGVISPTAALSSFPYTPEKSMKVLRFLYNEADSLIGEYGPYDAFSLEHGWYLPRYLAIDQGPIPVMIENYRTGFLWDLFMSCPEVKTGMNKLGFAVQNQL